MNRQSYDKGSRWAEVMLGQKSPRDLLSIADKKLFAGRSGQHKIPRRGLTAEDRSFWQGVFDHASKTLDNELKREAEGQDETLAIVGFLQTHPKAAHSAEDIVEATKLPMPVVERTLEGLVGLRDNKPLAGRPASFDVAKITIRGEPPHYLYVAPYHCRHGRHLSTPCASCATSTRPAGRSSGSMDAFDLFDDVGPAIDVNTGIRQLERHLGGETPELLPVTRLIKPEGLALLANDGAYRFKKARAFAVEAKPGLELVRVAKKIRASLVSKRALSAADPFLHDLTLYVVDKDRYVAEPSTSPGRASGDTTRFTRVTRTPLDYGTAINVQRIELVDPNAPPPEPFDAYFAETRRTTKYGKNGKLLKTPKVEITPGAGPGVVAFLDFSEVAHGTDRGIYIHYMKTRRDMLRRGLAKDVLEALVQRYGKDVYYDFGRVLHDGAWRLKESLDRRGYRTYGKLT